MNPEPWSQLSAIDRFSVGLMVEPFALSCNSVTALTLCSVCLMPTGSPWMYAVRMTRTQRWTQCVFLFSFFLICRFIPACSGSPGLSLCSFVKKKTHPGRVQFIETSAAITLARVSQCTSSTSQCFVFFFFVLTVKHQSCSTAVNDILKHSCCFVSYNKQRPWMDYDLHQNIHAAPRPREWYSPPEQCTRPVCFCFVQRLCLSRRRNQCTCVVVEEHPIIQG